jgi:antitoxin (DNA-binding transcriptional repressor) of toxin-antitoxin stability system
LTSAVKHVSLAGMETVTIRELRQNWPAVERRLAAVGGLTVTRDGTAVAELHPARQPAAKGKPPKRFNAAAHARWLKKVWGNEKPAFTSEQLIAESRAERVFSSK